MGTEKTNVEREYKVYDQFAIDEGINLYNSYRKYFARYCAPHNGDWDSMPTNNKLVWVKTALEMIGAVHG